MNKIWWILACWMSLMLFFYSCETETFRQGRILYTNFCADCHMDDASGLKGVIPPLARADYVRDHQLELPCIIRVGMEGEIRILKIQSVNMYFFKYFGQSELYLNGQLISNDRHHILNQGSSLRSSKMKPIYYSDIISKFISKSTGTHAIEIFKCLCKC